MEKNNNIERIRIISCIMVIAIHVANYYTRAYGKIDMSEFAFSVVLNTISRVSVPCFFMITGYLLLGREESFVKNLKRAGSRLFVLAVWSVVFYFVNMYYTHEPMELDKILSTPTEAHLWYLYTLIPLYLAMPLLQWFVRKLSLKYELGISIGIFAVFFASLIFDMNRFLSSGLFQFIGIVFMVFLGYWIRKYQDRILKSPMLWRAIYLISSVGTFLLVFLWIAQNHVQEFSPRDTPLPLRYHSPLIVIASVAFFLCILQRKGKELKPWLNSFAMCSFGIYLSHILFLEVFKVHVLPQDYSAWFVMPSLTIVLAILTWGFVFIIQKVKVGRMITR